MIFQKNQILQKKQKCCRYENPLERLGFLKIPLNSRNLGSWCFCPNHLGVSFTRGPCTNLNTQNNPQILGSQNPPKQRKGKGTKEEKPNPTQSMNIDTILENMILYC
jgi:hypothetical protein